MDFDKLTIEEVRKMDAAVMRETIENIRRELATMRMDIYTAANAQVGKIRKLKAGLARILTVKTEANKGSAKTVPAPVAKKAPAAKKVAKAAAPKKAKKTK